MKTIERSHRATTQTERLAEKHIPVWVLRYLGSSFNDGNGSKETSSRELAASSNEDLWKWAESNDTVCRTFQYWPNRRVWGFGQSLEHL